MAERKEIPRRYMVATKAFHMLGDISSEVPNLCSVHAEEKDYYIGEWVTGFGFIDVKFPKSSTREPTEKEKADVDGTIIAINDIPRFIIKIK